MKKVLQSAFFARTAPHLEVLLGPGQTSKIELFSKIIDAWKLLPIFAKPGVDFLQGSEHISATGKLHAHAIISQKREAQTNFHPHCGAKIFVHFRTKFLYGLKNRVSAL